MTTAVPSTTQPIMPFSPCNWVGDICQKIHDLAIKFFKTVSDWFSGKTNSLSQTTTITTMNGNPGNLVAFYRGAEANNNGVSLNQILSWDDANLELVHTYIQWLFPLTTQSGPNPTAPVLDQATIDTFRNDPLLRGQLLRAFRRMLTFYGLQMDETTRVITRAPNFNARAMVWLTPPDGNYHNFLRITRIIHSLCLLGHRECATSLLAIMIDIAANEGARTVPPETLQHWNNAAR
jgi:hypothetical protein